MVLEAVTSGKNGFESDFEEFKKASPLLRP